MSNFMMIKMIIVGVILIVEGITDIKKHEIYINVLLIGLIVSGLVMVFEGNIQWMSIISGLTEGIVLAVMSLLTKGEIGMGDAFLCMVTGIILGGRYNMAMFLFAGILCSIFSAFLLMIKKAGKKTKIPFVPFLIPGYLLMNAMRL